MATGRRPGTKSIIVVLSFFFPEAKNKINDITKSKP